MRNPLFKALALSLALSFTFGCAASKVATLPPAPVKEIASPVVQAVKEGIKPVAQAAEEMLPPVIVGKKGHVYDSSIAALEHTFVTGHVSDIQDSLSKDFALKGVPPQMNMDILTKVFTHSKGKFGKLEVLNEKPLDNGFELKLKGKANIPFVVIVDQEGKFTNLKFFSVNPKIFADKTSQNLTAPDYQQVPFELFGRLMMIKGEINGVKGYLFVDSGAPYCVLNSAVFNQVKGKNVAIHGVSGVASGGKSIMVKSLKFGDAELKNFKGFCQPLNHLAKDKEVKLLGLIGYKELSAFEVLINYHKKSMLLFKVNDKGDKIADVQITNPIKVIKFGQVAHLPVLDCELNGEKLRMALDTGAEANLLDLKLQTKFAPFLQNKNTTRLVGGDNLPMTVSYGTLPLFKVGGYTFKNMHTLFSDISHLNSGNNGLKIDGLLGFEMLSKTNLVGINFKKRQLYIW